MPVATRNSDVEHAYRADSDLYWLTGFAEPEALAVLAPGRQAVHALRAAARPRARDLDRAPRRRRGRGARFGADQAFAIDEARGELPKLLRRRRKLYYRLGGDDQEFDAPPRDRARCGRARGRGCMRRRASRPRPVVHELRLRKDADGARSDAAGGRGDPATAHLAGMRAGAPGAYEYEMEALIDYNFRRGGGRGPGYGPSSAAGDEREPSSTTSTTTMRCATGELLLVDAGCEIDGYTADVTRT